MSPGYKTALHKFVQAVRSEKIIENTSFYTSHSFVSISFTTTKLPVPLFNKLSATVPCVAGVPTCPVDKMLHVFVVHLRQFSAELLAGGACLGLCETDHEKSVAQLRISAHLPAIIARKHHWTATTSGFHNHWTCCLLNGTFPFFFFFPQCQV